MEKPSGSVLHIGYPKAASTYLQKYLRNHPQVELDHVRLRPLVGEFVADVGPSARRVDGDASVHVVSNEKISESLIITGDSRIWHQNKFIPGAWNEVSSHIRVDPGEAARRVQKGFGCSKVLIVVRDQVDWLQSAYKYVLNKLPPRQRSFRDYCETPRGRVYLAAGHFDRTVESYADVFGPENVKVMRVEQLISDPEQFSEDFCRFLEVQPVPLPVGKENIGSTNSIAALRARFPFVEKLPSGVKHLGRHLIQQFGRERSMVLTNREIYEIREIYTESNERLNRLLAYMETPAQAPKLSPRD